MKKQFVRGKGSATVIIILSVCATLLIELIAGVAVCVGIEKSTLDENTMTLAGYVIRLLGILIAVIIAWVFEPKNKLLSAGVAAAVVAVLPVIAAMLFWRIDGRAIGGGLAVSVISFGVCVGGLSCVGSDRSISKYKKHYR